MAAVPLPDTSPEICRTCQGRGQVIQSSGFFTISSTCPHCGGHGKVITTPCNNCRGTGKENITKSVQLKIPAGVETRFPSARCAAKVKQEIRGAPVAIYMFFCMWRIIIFLSDQVTISLAAFLFLSFKLPWEQQLRSLLWKKKKK